MTNRIQKLVLAAVLASSVPAAALARDCDHDHDRDDRPPAAYAPPYGAPVAPPAYGPGYRAPIPAPAQWREARWRERELDRVRFELRQLDEDRARFYAENAYRPGKLRRYDRWYAVRRAELERRWNELQVVAWR